MIVGLAIFAIFCFLAAFVVYFIPDVSVIKHTVAPKVLEERDSVEELTRIGALNPVVQPYKNGKFFKRGIVQFLPGDKNYMKEFKDCIFPSWRYTCLQKSDIHPAQQVVKTDLIVFISSNGVKSLPDICKEVQIDPSGNYTLPHPNGRDVPISQCYWILQEISNYRKEWHGYQFVDNMVFLADKHFHPFLHSYDIMLKTESDTFLTPAFTHWIPTSFVIGKGGYVHTDLTRENLNRIGHQFDTENKFEGNDFVHDIGAALYGRPELITKIHEIAMPVLKHVLSVEFATDQGAWPSWFRGVSSMYAIEIGVNLAVDKFSINAEMLDYLPWKDKESILTHAHIHAWHAHSDGEMFSKQHYRRTGYEEMKSQPLNWYLVHHYCVAMVLHKVQPSKVIDTVPKFLEHQGKWIDYDHDYV